MQSSRWAAVGAALCAALAAAQPALAAGTVRRVQVPLASHGRAVQDGWRVTPAVHVSGGFRLLGLHWRGAAAAVFDVRVRPPGGQYGAWFPLDAEDLPVHAEQRLGTHRATEGAWIGRARALQVRYRGAVSSVTAIVVDPGADPRTRAATAVSGAPGRPPIFTRAMWGADERIRRHAPRYAARVSLAFVHHTATPNGYAARDTAAIVRSIYLYHVRGNGWDDIGYNFLVDRFGRVFEGRFGGVTANVIGAHTGGFNVGSVGVAVIGDFNGTSPSAAAMTALDRLLAWRLDVAHVDPRAHPVLQSQGNERFAAGRAVRFNAISGHRDAGLTDCPGRRLYALLPAVRRAVARSGVIKIYAPAAQPATIQFTAKGMRPVAFAARLSHNGHWRVRVTSADGRTIASFRGSGRQVAATWTGSVAGGGALPPAAALHWTIEASRKGHTALPAAGAFAAAPASATLSGVNASPSVIGAGGTGTVSYTLAAAATVVVAVQPAAGSGIVTLQPATAEAAGVHSAIWNATGGGGAKVGSGHYRYVVTATPTGGGAETGIAAVDVRRQVARLTVTAAISPNGDGNADTAIISYTRAETGDAAVQLLHGGKLAVRVASLYAQASGSFAYSWAAAGVPDGVYQLRLLAPGAGGPLDLRAPIMIDTHGPGLALSRVSRTHTRVVTRIRVSEAAVIQVRAGGRTIATVRARAAGRLRFAIRKAAIGSRRVLSLIATDRLGNTARPFHVRIR